MKKYLFSLIILIGICPIAFGQKKDDDRKAISPQQREEWLNEMRNVKHDYIARDLDLSDKQQEEFFPVYDEMDNMLNQISTETRELEQKVSDNENASDIEIETVARALFEQKVREGKLEIEYFDKFKEILSPRQLLRLKNTERKFTQQLVRQHGTSKAKTRSRK